MVTFPQLDTHKYASVRFKENSNMFSQENSFKMQFAIWWSFFLSVTQWNTMYTVCCVLLQSDIHIIHSYLPASISNHMSSKIWCEITSPFPNFNSCTVDILGMDKTFHVEVWEWISNFFPNFSLGCNYSSMLGFKSIHVSEGVPGFTLCAL